MISNGYIYVRNHPSYDLLNACKLGKTQNIPERDITYATGEIVRGNFDIIFEVPINLRMHNNTPAHWLSSRKESW